MTSPSRPAWPTLDAVGELGSDPAGWGEADDAGALLDQTRALRALTERSEALLVERAARWADWHTETASDGAVVRDEHGLPEIDWTATAEFAANLGLSQPAGEALLHESRELLHRLPRLWARIVAGEVAVWRGRRIAARTFLQPDDIAEYVDAHVAGVAHAIGPTRLDRLVDEAMLRLHPEEFELRHLDAMEQREARVIDAGHRTGVGAMFIKAEALDLQSFDVALSRIAAALAHQGNPDSLDVRRSQAVGVLADPARALALLAEAEEGGSRGAAREIVLHVHVDEETLHDHDVVARVEGLGGGGSVPVLESLVREWCGRDDTALRVQPVIDLRDHVALDRYEIGDRMRTRTHLAQPSCVFPYCSRPARRCDCDHIVPWDDGGASCDCNLAPLCRRHHRLKTLAAYRYTTVGPGEYLWTTPHGHTYLRDDSGTRRQPSDQAGGTGCLLAS